MEIPGWVPEAVGGACARPWKLTGKVAATKENGASRDACGSCGFSCLSGGKGWRGHRGTRGPSPGEGHGRAWARPPEDAAKGDASVSILRPVVLVDAWS